MGDWLLHERIAKKPIMMKVLKAVIVICLLVSQVSGQINFGGGKSKPNKRPSSGSVSFGGGQSQSKKTSLKELLGKDAPPTVNTRFGFGTRRQGEQCRTPLGEAGTCQFIFASQCSSILGVLAAGDQRPGSRLSLPG